MSTVMSRCRQLLCAVAMVVAPACAPLTWQSLDSLAELYVRTALRMAQHDPSLVEQWRGSESWRPGARVPVADLLVDLAEMERHLDRAAMDISSSAEYSRVHYLRGQVRALRFAADRQLGRATSIDEQARDEFDITFPPLDRSAVARAHEAIARLIPGAQPLAMRLDALRRDTIVPPEKRGTVIEKALDACRERTPTVIELPEDERVHAVFRSGLAWDAFARYAGNHVTNLDLNDDATLDVSRAFRIACHEGYPGHHLQHLLIDRLYEERQWPELLLAPAFGPHLLLLEGAAEVGADLALSDSARVYREQLFPAAGLKTDRIDTLVQVEALLPELLPVVTDVAREYLDGRLSEARAVDRLANEALVANPQGTLAFIERRRARALVYGEGRRVVYGMMKTRDLDGLYATFKRITAVK